MAQQVRRQRKHLAPNFNLGNDVAESDPLLDVAFYDSAVFQAVQSRTLPHCVFLVGRTGAGKSAVLKRLQDTNPDHVIRIVPENLSLPYISNLDVLRKLEEANVLPDPFFIALWKHVFLVEVIQHRYKVTTPQVKQNVLTSLRARLSGDEKKRHALEYLDEFSGKFWCETNERVRDILDHFETQLSMDVGVQIPLGAGTTVGPRLGAERGHTRDIRTEQAERYQRVVNEAQIAKLNEMISVLDDEILESDQHFTYILLDDLDKDWADSRIANTLLRCLLRALWDLQQVKHLKIVVALRTNIFDYLDFGSPFGGQEEKYRALTRYVQWSPNELRNMLDERARAAGELWRVPGGIVSLDQILPPPAKRRGGSPLDYVIERTLRRPRDVISYLNESFIISGAARLTWRDITAAEAPYSRKRLLALRDEWKPTFPGIDQLFEIFRRVPQPMPMAAMLDKVVEIGMLLERPMFPGVLWLTGMTGALWAGGQVSWAEQFQPIIRLLYEIGLIGCLPRKGNKAVYAYDRPEFAESAIHLESCEAFVVHPAFRQGLDILPQRTRVDEVDEGDAAQV